MKTRVGLSRYPAVARELLRGDAAHRVGKCQLEARACGARSRHQAGPEEWVDAPVWEGQMQYRGITFDIKVSIERGEWVWEIHTPKPRHGKQGHPRTGHRNCQARD